MKANVIFDFLDTNGIYILGMAVGILLIAILYLVFMLWYLHMRKNGAEHKYSNEIKVISIAIGISVIVKLIIGLIITDNKSMFDGASDIIKTIYTSIGRLLFEGLSDYAESGLSPIILFLYHGSSLFAGLVFLTVVSAKASYEIYSRIKLFILRRRVNKENIYVFTSVTKDSLVLSQSIKEKDKNAVIIFTGEDMEGFDKSNSLHREIMTNDYVYWPYYNSEDDDKKISILKRLNLKINNEIKNDVQKQRVHIFAFHNGENQTGLESKNSGVIYEEINILLNENNYLGEESNTIIDFYILSDNYINYNSHDYRLDNIIREKLGFDITEENLKKVKRHFQIHIISEAILMGRDILREKVLQSSLTKRTCHRAMILGFGQAGQETMKSLYVDAASESYGKSKFIADIFDKYSNSLTTLFSEQHPSICHLNIDNKEFYSFNILNHKIKKFQEKMKQQYLSLFKLSDVEDVVNGMNFPIVLSHDNDCFSKEFFEYLDKDTDGIKNKYLYDSYAITLGKDEVNIAMANLLIDSLKHEISLGMKLPNPLTIYVNIFDKDHRYLINWCSQDKEKFKNLNVIVFGIQENIYSYDEIIDDENDIIYNYGYNYIYNNQEDYDNLLSIKGDKTALIKKELQKLKSNISIEKNIRSSWLDVKPFNKCSNKFVTLFDKYYKISNNVSDKDIYNMAQMEHERWCRYCIANGWIFAKEKNIDIKEHTDLIPFIRLSKEKKANDIINVLLANKDNKFFDK